MCSRKLSKYLITLWPILNDMVRVLLFIISFSVSTLAIAQNYRLEIGMEMGASNYLGDIGGGAEDARPFIMDLKPQMTSASGSIYAGFAITPAITGKISYSYLGIRGNDSLSTNPGRNTRNLNFRNRISEIATTFDLDIYQAYNLKTGSPFRVDFKLYGTVGIGYFTHNPEAEFNGTVATNGKKYNQWVALQPLQTEGVDYSLSGIATILGGGFHFTLDRNIRIGFRALVRLTNSDYLDDVSSNYVDPTLFPNTEQGQLARELAYRADEKADVASYEEKYAAYDARNASWIRGNGDKDDSYFTMNLSVSYLIRGKGGRYNRKFHSGKSRRGGGKISVVRWFSP